MYASQYIGRKVIVTVTKVHNVLLAHPIANTIEEFADGKGRKERIWPPTPLAHGLFWFVSHVRRTKREISVKYLKD